MNGPVTFDGLPEERVRPLLEKLASRCDELGVGLAYFGPDETEDGPAGEVSVTEGSRASVRLALSHRDDSLGSVVLTSMSEADAEARLQAVVPTIEAVIRDYLMISELEDDVIDLADQITDAYEMLELMYALGNSMASLDDPDRFLSFTCKRVRETLGFGYVAVHLPESADVGPMLAGKTHWDGSAQEGTDAEHLDRLLSVMAHSEMSLDAFNGPQAVVRPLRNDQGVVGVMIAGDKHREAGNVSSYDTKLIDAIGGLLSTFLTNSRLYNEQREMAMGVLESLSAAIDAKDPYTRGHAQRVAHLSYQIAIALGYDAAHAERLRVAGLLHDVGKIGVAEAVLQKSGKLTRDEYEQIKKHPEIGHRILKDLKGLDDILPAVLHHHERLDGGGYPHGLKGDRIPMNARIVAAADTFDAMSSTRSYRARLPREEVLAEIRRSSGSQLDPDVVDALLGLDFSDFDSMIEQHSKRSTAA
ncbi:MAG: HD-GYP domain-containing protein [Planctomycetota bacterium]